MYLVIKALHIIFVVTWFAGLFYIVRLLIYQREAHEKTEAEKSVLLPQLKLMSKRLWYGITWPSAILTGILGGTLLYQVPVFLSQPWMILKLILVILLYAYHGYTHVLERSGNTLFDQHCISCGTEISDKLDLLWMCLDLHYARTHLCHWTLQKGAKFLNRH
jgi:uncharacterized integral membrane protein (TIGR00701 family)